MLDEALQAGGTIDDVRYCPHHPEAVLPQYRQAHPWRKPAPGMILDLIRAWELDPGRCALVGDQATDMQAAVAAGIKGHRYQGGDLCAFVAPILDGIVGVLTRAGAVPARGTAGGRRRRPGEVGRPWQRGSADTGRARPAQPMAAGQLAASGNPARGGH